METNHNIIMGDARDMGIIGDRSVQLIITSPPYWQLKDYGSNNQIGFDDSYEDYINNLNLVWHECYRVLEAGCRLCINIGDQFARSVYYGRYKVIPIRTEIIKFCETIGLDYMGAIIWQKVTTSNTSGGATVMGSFPYPRNGILKIDYEFILLFRKPGKPQNVNKELRELSRMTNEEWKTYFSGHWNFSGERQGKHLAMFPLELPTRLIKMFSYVGDSVLDPFLGSGTTSLAALKLKRNSIGYEVNDDFADLIKEKLGVSQPTMSQTAKIKFTTAGAGARPEPGAGTDGRDFRRDISKLPYVFRDSVKIDKKIDPREHQFGSKIHSAPGSPGEKYFSVTEVCSATEIVLSDGSRVRLLGVKAIQEKLSEARDFLLNTIQGKKVFLRFDKVKFDEQGNLLGYVYLKNKTFINAQLIKKGFARADTGVNSKYEKRFLRYEAGTGTEN